MTNACLSYLSPSTVKKELKEIFGRSIPFYYWCHLKEDQEILFATNYLKLILHFTAP